MRIFSTCDSVRGMKLVIDPGLHGCGATFGIKGVIKRAAYVRGNPSTKAPLGDLWYDMAEAVLTWDRNHNFEHSTVVDTELVIECPQVYKASHQRGGKERTDPQDIVNLAACVGAIVAKLTYPQTKVYLPREWKGQVPKDICHARAIKALTSEERAEVDAACTEAGKLAHNVLDSVAMYLKHVGRVV